MIFRKSVDPAPYGTGKNCLFGLFICLAILFVYCNGCTTKNSVNEQEQTSQGRQFSNSKAEGNTNTSALSILEDERKALEEKMDKQRQTIYELAQEYGTTELSIRYDMMQKRVNILQAELTKIENNRLNLEEQIKDLKLKADKTTDEEQKLTDMCTELDVIKKQENQIRGVISQEGAKLTTLNRKQQAIDKFQSELILTKKSHDAVCEKIKELTQTGKISNNGTRSASGRIAGPG